jgi:molecular chaperone DnaK (HSP70)
MSEQELRQLIEKLRAEVDTLPDEDVEARERLDAIIGELDKKLQEPGSEDHHGLISNLQDSIKEMEARHPDTTTLLNNIMMTLANMGI